MLFRVKHQQRAGHVHARVFVGDDAEHLALSGQLVMDEEQFNAFADLLDGGHALGRESHDPDLPGVEIIDETPPGGRR